MTLKLFVTGTDTEIGKTYVSVSLLKHYQQQGFSTLGIKPVASGCNPYSEDALLLQEASTVKLPYAHINPFAFAPPIAPHLAAQQIGCDLTVAAINQQLQTALTYPADVCIIEGVGGWHTPLNATETITDFVKQQALPVILVVGMRLGCLNHALLTARAIEQDGLTLYGWIANCIDPQMLYREENIATLQQRLLAPCLGVIPHSEKEKRESGVGPRGDAKGEGSRPRAACEHGGIPSSGKDPEARFFKSGLSRRRLTSCIISVAAK